MSASQLPADCEVCCEEMVQPRSLPCGHTFCQKCLQQLIDRAMNITCPKDRRIFHVPNGDAANLARNYYLEDLLENLRRNRTTVKSSCAVHVTKQAKFFCESCMKSICSKCVLNHRAHDCVDYSESRDKCALRIQQLLTDVGLFQQAVDNELTAKSSAVEAQVAACKRKVDAAVSKIHSIVQVLNATAESLQKTASQCRQFILGAFKLDDLESLQQKVAQLSSAALSLSDLSDGVKLELRFEQVDELTQKVEVQRQRGRLTTPENIPELSRWFSDSQLSQSLEMILEQATKLRQNLANDTKGYCSLHQLMSGFNNQHKDLLILTGGLNNTSSVAYDPKQDSWRQIAPLSCARNGIAATLWCGKMVVAGGWNYKSKWLKLVEQYNPESNCWTALPNLLQRRQWLALACFEQSLFAIGGYNGTNYLDSVEQYTLNLQQWQHVATLNTARSGLCCAVLQAGILVAGGFDGSKRLSTCELFDGVTQVWNYAGSLVTARANCSAAKLNDTVYIFGGSDGANNLDSVEEYDSGADMWTLLPVRLSVPRQNVAAATVNGRIYVCGGIPNGVVESFDADDQCILYVAALPKTLRRAAAVCVRVTDDFYTQLFETDDDDDDDDDDAGDDEEEEDGDGDGGGDDDDGGDDDEEDGDGDEDDDWS